MYPEAWEGAGITDLAVLVQGCSYQLKVISLFVNVNPVYL